MNLTHLNLLLILKYTFLRVIQLYIQYLFNF